MTVMTKAENIIQYLNHYGLVVYFANDQLVGLSLGRWESVHCLRTETVTSNTQKSMGSAVVSIFISQPWLELSFVSSASFRYIPVLISEHLTEAERSRRSKEQKGGHALAWCLTVSTTPQLEQNSAMPPCCVSLKTTTVIKMLLCNNMSIPSRHFNTESICKNVAS